MASFFFNFLLENPLETFKWISRLGPHLSSLLSSLFGSHAPFGVSQLSSPLEFFVLILFVCFSLSFPTRTFRKTACVFDDSSRKFFLRLL